MTVKEAFSAAPAGLRFRYAVQHSSGKPISGFCWSPDGRRFAVAQGNTLEIRDTASGTLTDTFAPAIGFIHHLAWAPDGNSIAACGGAFVQAWDDESGRLIWGHEMPEAVSRLSWSPSGQYLALASEEAPVRILDVQRTEIDNVFIGRGAHATVWLPRDVLIAPRDALSIGAFDLIRRTATEKCRTHATVADIAWSHHHQVLILPSIFGPIEIRDSNSGQLKLILEGHTSTTNSVSLSADGRLLASRSYDKTVRLWNCSDWSPVVTLQSSNSRSNFPVLAFHPKKPLIGVLSKTTDTVDIWEVDVESLLNPKGAARGRSSTEVAEVASRPVRYVNAKVVLVGDAGVGKSGLGLVLTKQKFVPTFSTHGRNVWLFESKKVRTDKKHTETRETLLWDLAGQPGYRLVHQLHLNEIAVALVMFDAQSETDPLAGVRHWDRALRQAQRIQGSTTHPLKKILVAARVDRGHVSLSKERIDALVRSLGFDGFFRTSAKEGWEIAELTKAIRKSINWDALPRVSSTEFLEKLKAFLLIEKEAGRLLSTVDELFRAFLKSHDAPGESPELREQFEMCIGRVEWRGLIRRLSFGGFVLLQPELLDGYASALVNAAKEEPDGLGSIAEEVARSGKFPMSHDERVKSPAQEKLLLIAMVEDLLHHEIALREHADGGPYLTFPSQLTREMPDLQELKGKAGVFGFEGPVLNIYATLVVRLSHSNWFQKKALWKNAAVFTTKARGSYGIALREPEEGKGEITLFYDAEVSSESRLQFEEYILAHLRRRALPDTLSRRRIVTCFHCGTPISDEQATRRLEFGRTSIECPVCDTTISLHALVEQVPAAVPPRILEMERGADARRDAETAATTIQGKRATRDFDVFISYNSTDRETVLTIARSLEQQGILPWIDIEACPPGKSWQKELSKQFKRCKAAAVFVGQKGIGPWQQAEVEALLIRFKEMKRPVIPVLLEDAPKQPVLPIFLGNLTWVDFRQKKPDPLRQLAWGITGRRP
jgi:GTPase SAR1 family protein